MHGVAPNPALTQPEPDHGHRKQPQTTQQWRKHRSDQCSDGRPNHHHGNSQAFADRLLAVDGHLCGGIQGTFPARFHREEGVDIAYCGVLIGGLHGGILPFMLFVGVLKMFSGEGGVSGIIVLCLGIRLAGFLGSGIIGGRCGDHERV